MEKPKLKIELNHWDYTCGDGCCYMYGIDIKLNGEKIENEDGENREQLLRAILNKLGYEVEISSYSNGWGEDNLI